MTGNHYRRSRILRHKSVQVLVDGSMAGIGETGQDIQAGLCSLSNLGAHRIARGKNYLGFDIQILDKLRDDA